jgi:hypothetical protein
MVAEIVFDKSKENFIKELEDFLSTIDFNKGVEPVLRTGFKGMLMFQKLVDEECERRGIVKTGFAQQTDVQQELIYKLANGAELKVKLWQQIK